MMKTRLLSTLTWSNPKFRHSADSISKDNWYWSLLEAQLFHLKRTPCVLSTTLAREHGVPHQPNTFYKMKQMLWFFFTVPPPYDLSSGTLFTPIFWKCYKGIRKMDRTYKSNLNISPRWLHCNSQNYTLKSLKKITFVNLKTTFLNLKITLVNLQGDDHLGKLPTSQKDQPIAGSGLHHLDRLLVVLEDRLSNVETIGSASSIVSCSGSFRFLHTTARYGWAQVAIFWGSPNRPVENGA